jgi:uncharacterized protein YjfI (DUF2170 family)
MARRFIQRVVLALELQVSFLSQQTVVKTLVLYLEHQRSGEELNQALTVHD